MSTVKRLFLFLKGPLSEVLLYTQFIKQLDLGNQGIVLILIIIFLSQVLFV